MGRDWIVVRLTPRTANSVRISSSAPGWSSGQEQGHRGAVRAGAAGSGPGGDTTTNRVTALARSCTSGAMTAKAVPVRGEGACQRGVHLPVGGLTGRLGVGRQRHPLTIREAGGEPAAALRHGLRVAADPLDVAERGPRPGQQRERDGDLQFRPDDHAVPGGQVVEGRGDHALDRALIGTTACSAVPSQHRGEGGLDGGQDSGSAPGSTGAQRRLENVPSGPR
mgnify:CR=1 FL=1